MLAYITQFAVRMARVKRADRVIGGMDLCSSTSQLSFMNDFLQKQREGPDDLIVLSTFNFSDLTLQSHDA